MYEHKNFLQQQYLLQLHFILLFWNHYVLIIVQM